MSGGSVVTHDIHRTPSSSASRRRSLRTVVCREGPGMSGRVESLAGLFIGLCMSVAGVANAGDCRTASRVTLSREVGITITQQRIAREPIVLGLNLEVAPFQRDFWDPTARRVKEPAHRLLASLQEPLIRYPGGTPSNRIDLLATVGDSRPPQLLAEWLGPHPVHFGLREYAQLAADLGVPGWLVLDVMGIGPGKPNPEQLAARNRRVVDLFRAEHSLLRVELGNEPFFPRYGLSGAEYAARLLPTLREIRQADPRLRSVVALAGFDMGPMKADRFNNELLDALAGADVDYSFHYYYDGAPGGPPLPLALDNLCGKLQWLERRLGRSPAVWLTEHGRWPGGRVGDPDWKQRWPESYNLGAAMSVAEFVIATAPWPQIRGALLHGVGAAGGPWHQIGRSDGGEYFPSATLLAQSMLQSLQGSQVLVTAVAAPFSERRPATRAVAFHRGDAGVSLLLTRRDAGNAAIRLTIPEFANRIVPYTSTELHAAALTAANTPEAPRTLVLTQDQGELRFDTAGVATLNARGPAVLLVSFGLRR